MLMSSNSNWPFRSSLNDTFLSFTFDMFSMLFHKTKMWVYVIYKSFHSVFYWHFTQFSDCSVWVCKCYKTHFRDSTDKRVELVTVTCSLWGVFGQALTHSDLPDQTFFFFFYILIISSIQQKKRRNTAYHIYKTSSKSKISTCNQLTH